MKVKPRGSKIHHESPRRTSEARSPLDREAHHSATRTRSPSRGNPSRVSRALGKGAHHSTEVFTPIPSSRHIRSQRSRQRRRAALARFLRNQLNQHSLLPETSGDSAVPVHPALHRSQLASSPKRLPRKLEKAASPRKPKSPTKTPSKTPTTGQIVPPKPSPGRRPRPVQKPISPRRPPTKAGRSSGNQGVRSKPSPQATVEVRARAFLPITQLPAPENVPDRPSDAQSSTPRLNLARSPPGQKGRRYKPPSGPGTSGAFSRLGPPVKPEHGYKGGPSTPVGTNPRGQPRITRVPPSPGRFRTTSSRGKHGRGRIRPAAPDLIEAVVGRREGRLEKGENQTGQVAKSPVKPPKSPERPRQQAATRGTRPPPDLLHLFGDSPPRTPGRPETRTPSNTPPTPGRGLELLPSVKVVINPRERQLAELGNQSPLVRRRWRASRLSETSSEQEPAGRIIAEAAEEILLEEASPARLTRAAEVLERALP
ncbi:hypothetical protein DMENIID0001_111920 [Sergentomyia squamirostris]